MNKKYISIFWRSLSSLAFLVGLIVGLTSYGIRRIRGHLTIDQIVYHLKMPASTIEGCVVWKLIGAMWAEIILAVILSYCYLWYNWHRESRIGRMIFRGHRQYLHDHHAFISGLIAILIFCFGLLYAAKNHEVVDFWLRSAEVSTLIDEFYVDESEALLQNGAPRRNLILIVSESLEQTFAQPELFDDNLIPELTELQEENQSFSSLIQVQGAQYTVAALYSMLYGLPLLPNRYMPDSPDSDVASNYFPHSKSLLDILAAHGYRICYIQGGRLNFAGKSALFDHLKNAEIIGLDTIEADPERADMLVELNDWGLYDRNTLTIAKEKLREYGSQKTPFCLMVLTVDAHVGNDLDPQVVAEYEDDRDVIRLQSRLIGDFVKWVQKQKFADSTLIAIVGDHLMMADEIGETSMSELEKNAAKTAEQGDPILQRSVFNCFINPAYRGWRFFLEYEGRQMAQFDMAATILDAMGFNWKSKRFGLGVSMFSKQQTLLEKYGFETWQEESRRYSEKYYQLTKP